MGGFVINIHHHGDKEAIEFNYRIYIYSKLFINKFNTLINIKIIILY